jgi:hypothetical protein
VIEDISYADTRRSAGRNRDVTVSGPSLEAVSERLQTDYPSVEREQIVTLLGEAFAQTNSARVQSFRMLLAERNVRAALRT